MNINLSLYSFKKHQNTRQKYILKKILQLNSYRFYEKLRNTPPLLVR